MKQSGFLKKQEQQKEELLNKGQGIIIQYMVDTLQMTLWTEYGWEYDSIMALTEAWRVTRKEHKEALEPHNAMADVKQEHMQRVFREINRFFSVFVPNPAPAAEKACRSG